MLQEMSLRVKRLAADNESQFLGTTKAHRGIPLKEHAVQINIARKKHPHKRSEKSLDALRCTKYWPQDLSFKKRTNIPQ